MDKTEIAADGSVERIKFNSLTKELTIERKQDITANLELSKMLAKDDELTKQGIKNGMWRYAHIPNMILEQWAQMGVNINDTKELVRMINKPEYRHLKTTTKTHA